VSLTASI